MKSKSVTLEPAGPLSWSQGPHYGTLVGTVTPRPATSGQHSVAHSQQRRRLGGTCAAVVGNNPWTGAQILLMLESNPHLMPDASLTRSLHRSRLPRRRLDLAPSVVGTPAQRSDPAALPEPHVVAHASELCCSLRAKSFSFGAIGVGICFPTSLR